ncbi:MULTISPECIES: T4 family baseplate hub assembly chaperone [Nostocales]|uniref:Phage baseplate protein n=2 Tax=Nostocales TaxID=1161 RepID=A0A0C1RET8_9CYAN|nr:T4 bacteriophage base plate protein [Tolypothrix bouteillei]KAF3886741.1 phage baseplate protein [Tolypothrix bouteillei VB521301]
MRSLSSLELFNIWDWGHNQPSWSRAIKLLATACPDVPVETLTQFSIGQRDAMLLTLREWTFGSQLASQTACPKCGEALELNFNVADVRMVSPQLEPVEKFSLSQGEYQVSFRLPNTSDLMAICTSACKDVLSNPQQHNALTTNQQLKTAQQVLLDRCILSVTHNSESLSLNKLPTNIINTIIAEMAQADPQANVPLDTSCPACGHEWQLVFDIMSFFWSEINAWGLRILRDVHTLATAYGWREADILTMSPRRRQLYLDMVVSK